MPLPETIDNSVQEFEQSFITAQDSFIDDVEALKEEGLSIEEIMLILAGIDIATYWLIDLDMQQASILQYTTDLGSKVRLSLVQGVLNDMPKKRLREMLLRDLSTKPYQIDTIITTSMATYSRSLTLLQLEDKPEEKLIYTGPLDSKTRPVCIRMLKEGGLTQSQIDAKYPGALRDGGGFNCRHQWQSLSPKTQDKEVQQQAKTAYQGMMQKAKKKGKPFKAPKTLEEYYR